MGSAVERLHRTRAFQHLDARQNLKRHQEQEREHHLERDRDLAHDRQHFEEIRRTKDAPARPGPTLSR